MKKIIPIAILAVLGIGSFLGSYLMFKKPPEVATSQPAEPSAASQPVVLSLEAAIPIPPAGMQLDDLVRQLQEKKLQYEKDLSAVGEEKRRLKIANDALKAQSAELENLRVQLASQVMKANEALAQLEKTQLAIAQNEQANLKRAAMIYEKMDATAGGKMIEGMCSNNQEDDAAKILHFMSERSAAKLLAEITDKNVAARLSLRLKNVAEKG